MKHGKQYRESLKKYNPSESYDLKKACELVKELKFAKFDETIEMPIVREQQWAIEYNGISPVKISWSELASAPVGTIWGGKHKCEEYVFECVWRKVAESKTNIYIEFIRTKINDETDDICNIETIQIVYQKLVGNVNSN